MSEAFDENMAQRVTTDVANGFTNRQRLSTLCQSPTVERMDSFALLGCVVNQEYSILQGRVTCGPSPPMDPELADRVPVVVPTVPPAPVVPEPARTNHCNSSNRHRFLSAHLRIVATG